MIVLLSILLFHILRGFAYPTNVDFEYNPMENPDLMEGDIETDEDTDRSSIIYKQLLWANGVIPYAFDSEVFKTVDRKTIQAAIKEFNDRTCLKFIPRTKEKDYIRFVTGVGCKTKVGRYGGEHKITLGKGCNLVGTVMHEIGHAIGFYHEHNRSDRHKYIKVIWENIQDGKQTQFKERAPGTDLLITPFDINSLMLYGSYFFSKNPKKLQTMMSLTNEIFPDVRKRSHLSPVDVYRISKLYKCGK